jgi:hypothetical protein
MIAAATGHPRRTRQVILSFVELQIPMVLGAFGCYLLGRLVSDTSLASAYRPGTYLFAIGDVFFLTAPVMVWMLFRGHSGRQATEMAMVMLAPVAFIALVGELAEYPYLPWLITGMYPAMSLGIIIFLVYSRDGSARSRHEHPPSAHAQP